MLLSCTNLPFYLYILQLGLVHPCIKGKDGKFRPNFASRYMTEDIPYGLLVMKGIAEVAGVETPKIDMVLNWSQKQMGKCIFK